LKARKSKVSHRSFVELISCYKIIRTHAADIESHENGNLQINGNLDCDQIENNVSIRSYDIKPWPPIHLLRHPKHHLVPSLFISVFQIIFIIIKLHFEGAFSTSSLGMLLSGNQIFDFVIAENLVTVIGIR
jgi:nicotinamidase-related amidase